MVSWVFPGTPVRESQGLPLFFLIWGEFFSSVVASLRVFEPIGVLYVRCEEKTCAGSWACDWIGEDVPCIGEV
jgi:hypothetical protein